MEEGWFFLSATTNVYGEKSQKKANMDSNNNCSRTTIIIIQKEIKRDIEYFESSIQLQHIQNYKWVLYIYIFVFYKKIKWWINK